MGKRESTGGASTASQLLRSAIASHEKTLTAKGRKHIKKGSFAIPPDRYPIHDISHARNALARVAQHGTPDEQKKVKSAVHAKYPSLAGEAAETLMKSVSFRESNAIRIVEAETTPKGEGPRVKIVLIDEGLGNRRNMNYYGPEAIASAVKEFEGKPSYANHPSESEETDLPERDVLKQYGFYKGLKVEEINGKSACTGYLHFDTSELGKQMYCKALTALEYQKQFPDSGMQYMGWSVIGGGKGETREMKIDGEDLEVNYVTEFLEGESCDAVTRAGRGGRVLAIAEDIYGKEAGMIKKLKATLAKLQESAKKAAGEDRKLLEASANDLIATIKTAEDDAAMAEEADPFEAMCSKREDEAQEAYESRLAGMAKMLADKMKPAEEVAPEPKEEPAEDPDTQEAKRDAVKSYAAEAGLPKGAYSDDKIKRLSKLPYREAKALIDDDAKLAEASRAELSRELEVPIASLRPGARESVSAAKVGRGNAALKESFSRED